MYPLRAIGRSFEQQKQLAQAEAYYLRALQVGEKYYGPQNFNVVMMRGMLAQFYYNQQQFDKAEPIYHRTFEGEEARVGKESFQLVPALEQMGGFYAAWHKYDVAELYYRRALALKEKQFGTNGAELAGTLTSLANVKRGMGAMKEAQQLEKRRDALAKTAAAGNPK